MASPTLGQDDDYKSRPTLADLRIEPLRGTTVRYQLRGPSHIRRCIPRDRPLAWALRSSERGELTLAFAPQGSSVVSSFHNLTGDVLG